MDYYPIGFTGTRHGMTPHQKSTLTAFLKNFSKPCIFRHGDCIGSDYTAHGIAQKFGFRIIIHPPVENRLRAFCSGAFSVLPPKEYLERDRDIVHLSERLFACVQSDIEDQRSGTWYTIRYAKDKKVPITIIYPDGQFEDIFPWE